MTPHACTLSLNSEKRALAHDIGALFVTPTETCVLAYGL
jgi:hypothetical protein